MLHRRGFRDFNSTLHDKHVQEYLKIAQVMAPMRFQLHNQGFVVCIYIWNRARHYMKRLGGMVDPEANCIPRTRTVVAALISLAVFFVVGGLAIRNALRSVAADSLLCCYHTRSADSGFCIDRSKTAA